MTIGVNVMAEKKPGQKRQIRRKDKQEDLAVDRAGEDDVDVLLNSDKQTDKEPVAIVGVGVSAGGLEAFTRLLEKLPGNTGMAFVLVQHLDPTRKSSLADIFSGVTSMPVIEAENKTAVHPDHIYVIPPSQAASISQGVLNLVAREDILNQYLPVDYFLTSLARDQGHKATGVILSGTTADGSCGLKEIKSAGGVTFAQKPQTAKFEGMPLNAIATGAVEFVLSPEDIASKLAKIACGGFINSEEAEKARLFSADELNQIFIMVRKASGTDLSDYRELTVKRRILRRMFLHKLEQLGDYVDYLRENPPELKELYHDLLINVTSFFRDPKVFETLKKRVFPAIMENRASEETVRIWVPGCSSGEEAYSIAIVCAEFFGQAAFRPPIKIFATDVNDTLIDKARIGIYPPNIAADVAPGRLRRFFTRVENGYQISKTIRDMCIFARQDMVKDPPFSRLDLISCRNAIIYFGPALHKKIFPVLHYALREGGFLLLGISESVGVFSNLFHLVDKKHKIYTKKAVLIPLIPRLAAGEFAAAALEINGRSEQTSPAADHRFNVLEEANRIVLSKYAPAGVIINSDLEIIHFRGRTGDYLEHPTGTPTIELLKMARGGLAMGLRCAVNKAKQENSPVRKEGLRVFHNGFVVRVNVDVIPIGAPYDKEKYYLILFEKSFTEAGSEGKDSGGAEAGAEQETGEGEDKQLNKLRHELNANKEYLRSVTDQYESANEELRAAYEEIQSSNEELQSMNEELETAKEELQSTNEELMALNDEMQKRNLELDEISSDLFNLFRCINIPVIMLGYDLRIRRFNPPAEKVFKLISTDIGRPITDINTGLNNACLEQAILEVTDTLVSKELEGQDRHGNWYSVQIRPFRTVENKIDGVIITYIDIGPAKKLALTEEALEYAEAIVETVREPLLVLDADLRVKSANKSFFSTFAVTSGQTLGRNIFELGNGQWDIPKLRSLLEGILAGNIKFEDFEVIYEFPQTGRKKMLVNASRLFIPGNQTKMILMTIDIRTLF